MKNTLKEIDLLLDGAVVKEDKITDYDLVKKYILDHSQIPEEDLKKAEEDKEFFLYILTKAQEQ